MHFASIETMPNIQVRNVPDPVHQRLKVRAAQRGQSLNELLLAELGTLAQLPTLSELSARIREREPYHGPSSAAIIREERVQRAAALDEHARLP
jgi:hypothetical protein